MELGLKIKEFERRIKALELKNTQSNFNYVRFRSCGQEAASQTFAYNFKTFKKCVLKLRFIVYAQYAPGKNGCVKINGVKFKDFLPKNGKTEIECFVPFEKGTQSVSLHLSGEEEFIVDNCEFETFGCVDYPENGGELCVLNEEKRSVILFSHDKKAVIIEYSGEELNERAECDNVFSAAIFALTGGGYVLACANDKGVLKAYVLSEDFAEKSSVSLCEKGVISVCAFGGESPCFYAVKGSKVVKYAYNEKTGEFVFAPTTYRAKRVTANPSVPGYLILTGFDGANKLVSLGEI